MLKNIKIPTNHKVVGFDPVKVYDQYWHEREYYRPIFKRILDLNSIVAEEDGKLYLLHKDNVGITSSGDHITIVPFRYATPSEIEKFNEELKSNKLMLKDGKIIKYKETWWRPHYTISKGFVPIEIETTDERFSQFKDWGEIFDSKEKCANWCNYLNETLNRDYPTV